MNSENQLWSSPNLEEEEDDDDEDEGSVKSIEWGGSVGFADFQNWSTVVLTIRTVVGR